MEDNIIKQLKGLREMEPGGAFAASSRQAILATRQGFPFHIFFQPVYAGSFAALILAVTLSLLLFSGRGSSAYASLDMDDLQTELEELTISIKLDEIAYSESVNETVALALQEISNDGDVRHLNTNLLEAEQEMLKLDSQDGGKIDALLDTVLF